MNYLFLITFFITISISTSTQAAQTINEIRIEIAPEDAQLLKKGRYTAAHNPKITVNGVTQEADQLKTRGQNCLKAKRRCLGIRLPENVQIHRSGQEDFSTRRFNLASMFQDESYTTTNIGYRFYNQMGLFPPKFAYTTLYINNQPYGLYMLVEKPGALLRRQLDSPFIVRRAYFSSFYVKRYSGRRATYTNENGEDTTIPEESFKKVYRQIATVASNQRGEALYNYLNQKIDMEQYLQYLAINTLLRNGDYLDEVYFYATPLNDQGSYRFKIMGWDPDGLFSPPHIGFRNTLLARWERNKTLLYSLEAKLDRKIARDRYLYSQFKKVLNELLIQTFTEKGIKELFDKVHTDITPYLGEEGVLAGGKRDQRKAAYTKEGIENRLNSRFDRLLKRRVRLLERLSY